MDFYVHADDCGLLQNLIWIRHGLFIYMLDARFCHDSLTQNHCNSLCMLHGSTYSAEIVNDRRRLYFNWLTCHVQSQSFMMATTYGVCERLPPCIARQQCEHGSCCLRSINATSCPRFQNYLDGVAHVGTNCILWLVQY